MLYPKRPPPQKYIWTRPTQIKRRLLYMKKLTRVERRALLATGLIWTLVVWIALGLMLWQDGVVIWHWLNGVPPVLAQPLPSPTPFGPLATATLPPTPLATRVIDAPQQQAAPSVVAPTLTLTPSPTASATPSPEPSPTIILVETVTLAPTEPVTSPSLSQSLPVTASAVETRPTRIVIDRVGINAPVVQVGWHVGQLEGRPAMVWEVADYAAGWHKNSALPGESGNTVLSAHNNINGEVFRPLDQVETGDKIVTYVGEQAFEYEVAFTTVVKEAGEPLDTRKRNARWIAPTNDERLTLVTCWPYPHSTHRFIVIARPTQRLAATSP